MDISFTVATVGAGTLISLMTSPDGEQVEAAYDRYATYVRQVLVGCGVPPADAPDLAQEVFLILLARVRPDPPVQLRGWLFQTARRVASNYRRGARRSRARLARLPDAPSGVSLEDVIARGEAAEFVLSFVADLDPDDRRLFLLSEIEGVGGTQIADLLDLNRKTAYSRVYALRRRFERRAADQFGRANGRGAWLGLTGFGATSLRTLGRGFWATAVVVVVAIGVAVFAWHSQQGPPESSPTPTAPISRWDPANEASLRDRLDAAAIEVRDARATLAGRVLDDGGSGIAGAWVCAWRHAIDFSTAEVRTPVCTRAGPSGEYRLEKIVPGKIRLTAASPGFLPGEFRLGTEAALRVSAGERSGLDITLSPGGAEFSGVVEDMTGGGVEGVEIALRAEPATAGTDPLAFGAWGDQPPVVIVSGKDGRFAGSVDEGVHRWQAVADGYAATRGETTAPTSDLTIRLAPESVLAGMVVDALGAPVAGARVVAWADTRSLTNAAGSVSTDSDGRFRISGLPPGRYKPWATRPGRLGMAERSLVLGVGETIEGIEIPIKAAPIVQGKVVVSGTGEPCLSGVVGLRESGRARSEWQEIGAEGEVVFPVVLAGTYRPAVACDGYRWAPTLAPINVGSESATGLTWSVSPGVTLAGQVLRSDGSAAAGALVTVYEEDGPTPFPRGIRANETGRFSTAGLNEGRYLVAASGDIETTPEPVSIDVDANTVEVTLRLGVGGVVRGVVTDEEGSPISGAVVRLAELERGTGRRRRTGGDGRFEFAGLPLRGYGVTASRTDRSRGVSTRAVLTADKPNSELQLQVGSAVGEVSGRVLDHDRAPFADALVTVGGGRSGVTVDQTSVLTDRDGRWTLVGLSQGPHVVWAVAPDGASGRRPGVTTQTKAPVEIIIEEPASAQGRVSVKRGDLPPVFEIVAAGKGRRRLAEVFDASDGTWSLEGLMPGPVTFSAVTAAGRASALVTLRPGEHARDIELKLLGRVDLTGQIVDLETGTPMSHYTVVATSFDDGLEELGKSAEIAVAMGPRDPRQVTGADGRFVVPDVSLGVVNLAAFPKGFPEASHGQVFTTIPVQAERELRFGVAKVRVPPKEEPGATGVTLERGDYDQPWTIGNVAAGGAAAAAGLRPGVAVTAIDGFDVTAPYKYLAPQLLRVPPGTTLTLTLSGDVEVELQSE